MIPLVVGVFFTPLLDAVGPEEDELTVLTSRFERACHGTEQNNADGTVSRRWMATEWDEDGRATVELAMLSLLNGAPVALETGGQSAVFGAPATATWGHRQAWTFEPRSAERFDVHSEGVGSYGVRVDLDACALGPERGLRAAWTSLRLTGQS